VELYESVKTFKVGAEVSGLGTAAELPSGGTSTVAVIAGGGTMAVGGVGILGGTKNMTTLALQALQKSGGTTYNGHPTDEHGNKLGGDGKNSQINRTRSNTRDAARNKSLNKGAGAVEHKNPRQGRPHFHPADGNGEKKPSSTHHEYPGMM
jgi:hypothetical protein